MAEEKDFAELVDESMSVPDKGKVLKGLVVRIDQDDVFIDFGSKSEGVVPIQEFYNKSGEPDVNIGEEVEVMFDNWANEGLPKLSRIKAEQIRENKRIQDHFDKGELIKAKITQKVKGGVIADVGDKIEIRAFIPGSQIDISPRQDLDSLVGETIEARIIKLAGNDIVLSRRVYLEEEREVLKKETLSRIEAGKEMSGKVVNIINQGVFVDLGGIEGFIPISELTWGRVAHPGDVLSKDQIIKTIVLRIEEGGKITLSLKDTTPDPWTSVKEKYKPGTQIKGKAVSITDFGVFVELEPGIEGLVHISEITWTKRFRHPKEIVQAGSPVEAVVLDVDSGNRRISLSLKQIEPSPWQLFKENNPQGSRIKGVIKNVTDKGLFVEVEENIVGLVRPDNISWKGRVNPEEAFEKGSEIDVVVLNVDDKNQRIGLGLKQLAADPWEEVQRKYKTGRSSVTGKVKDIKDSGIVIELDEGIEGYIRANELSQEKEQRDAIKHFKVGDEITAQVTGFDKRMRQVNLSKRKYDDWQDKERVSNFISSQGEPTAKLGDVLKEKLKQMNNDEGV